MAANQDVAKYIKDQVNAGFGKEQIYQALLNTGWNKEQINEAIYEIMGKSPEKPSQTAQKAQTEQKAGPGTPQSPGIFWKLKNVLFHPGRFFEAVKAETGIKKAFVFMFVVSLANVLALLAVFIYAGILGAPSPLSIFPVIFAAWPLLFSFLLSGITHGFVRIAGGKNGFRHTYKALAYAIAPAVFLPLIYPLYFFVVSTMLPTVSVILQIFIAFWSLYLAIRGISAFQGISAGKALTAIVFTSIVVIVAAFLTFYFLASFMNSAGLTRFIMSYFSPLITR